MFLRRCRTTSAGVRPSGQARSDNTSQPFCKGTFISTLNRNCARQQRAAACPRKPTTASSRFWLRQCMHCSRCCIWSRPQTGSDHRFARRPGPSATAKLALRERLHLSLTSRCNGSCCEFPMPSTSPQSGRLRPTLHLMTLLRHGGRHSRFADCMGSTISIHALTNTTPLQSHAAMASFTQQTESFWRLARSFLS